MREPLQFRRVGEFHCEATTTNGWVYSYGLDRCHWWKCVSPAGQTWEYRIVHDLRVAREACERHWEGVPI